MSLRVVLLPTIAVFLATVSVASAGPRTLEGSSPEEVRIELGEPDLSQQVGAGALWTYRFDTCALMVAFHATAGQLRVFEVMAGARRRGETPLSPAQCLAVGREQHAGHKSPDPIGDRLR